MFCNAAVVLFQQLSTKEMVALVHDCVAAVIGARLLGVPSVGCTYFWSMVVCICNNEDIGTSSWKYAYNRFVQLKL